MFHLTHTKFVFSVKLNFLSLYRRNGSDEELYRTCTHCREDGTLHLHQKRIQVFVQAVPALVQEKERSLPAQKFMGKKQVTVALLYN